MKGKASTAAPALSFRAALRSVNAHRATRLAVICRARASLLARGISCGRSRHATIRRAFYCLTDGYLGRGGIPL